MLILVAGVGALLLIGGITGTMHALGMMDEGGGGSNSTSTGPDTRRFETRKDPVTGKKMIVDAPPREHHRSTGLGKHLQMLEKKRDIELYFENNADGDAPPDDKEDKKKNMDGSHQLELASLSTAALDEEDNCSVLNMSVGAGYSQSNMGSKEVSRSNSKEVSRSNSKDTYPSRSGSKEVLIKTPNAEGKHSHAYSKTNETTTETEKSASAAEQNQSANKKASPTSRTLKNKIAPTLSSEED